jgi:arylformamidase
VHLVDLSHRVDSAMPVFPGDPEVELTPAGAQAPWQVTEVHLGSHSGTHIDAAAHYVRGGRTIDEYPLERFVLPAWIVPVSAGGEAPIEWQAITGLVPADLRDAAVLFATGWDRYWGRPEAERHPYLSAETARALVENGVGLVGTDALNIDATSAGTTHAHEVLLGADVLVVENLTGLGTLEPGRPYPCAFVPLKLARADGSPVRAYATVD